MNVVISGIYYPLAMLSYFVRAFQRRSDVDLFLAGPFTGNWIPWTDASHPSGFTLPQKYVVTPDYPMPKEAIRASGKVPSMLVNSALPWEADLWVQVDAGFHFANRPKAKVVALVQTDPHCLQYDLPRSYSDYSFCMQTPYLKEGDFYLPYAYDPTIHFPEEVDKEYDACLIGLLYDHRKKLIDRLRHKGLNVYYNIGEVFDEYRERYNKSKIALSWSSLQDLPARVWEALALGLPLVANRVPDMATFFVDGEHYLGFDTLDEAEAQVMKLINDPELAQTIADAGYRKVQPHTWDARVQQILETCKLL